jgi:dipeptidyl-peptidase 4
MRLLHPRLNPHRFALTARFTGPVPMALLATATVLAVAGPVLAQQPDYARAEQFLGWNLDPLVSGVPVQPQWLPGGERFWYRVRDVSGHSFVLVDPARGSRSPAFDQVRLAAALSIAADTSYLAGKLPFTSFEFVDGDAAIRVQFAKKAFRCALSDYTCATTDTVPDRRAFVASPDGRLEAFIHEHDLWIRPFGGGDSTRLTTDGAEYWSYGITAPRPSQLIRPQPVRPVLQWSPDGRRIAVQRMDERDAGRLPLYSSTHQRPKHYLYPYPLPGDSIIPTFMIHIVDVEAKTNTVLEMDPHPYLVYGTTGMQDSTWINVKWQGSDRIYFTEGTRGGKRIRLMEAEANTGRSRRIVQDSAASYVELNLDIVGGRPNWFVLNGGEDIIWLSERDGWAHLYRFGSDGNLKNRITQGAWTVGTVHHIDPATGRIFFTARGREPGRNPYLQEFYAVNLDGSGLTRLGGEEADHTIRATPNGRWFVDTYSTIALPPVSVLRDRTGRVVRTLEEGDASRLASIRWTPPEIFMVKARDGVTDLFGLLYRPTHFDPSRNYPVIEYIYPGPFIGSVGQWNFNVTSRGDQHALAELGFIVIQFDHLGTPFRSKAIQDNYYGNMGDNGLPDHIVALQQLAARHPWMDLTRVGIYGHSGGGFASTDAILRYPDFYKVAVSSAGNHDNRTYHAAYGEKYQGLLVRDTIRGTDSYANQINASLAANLRGKLFLMTGDMDDNVHPAMTIQVADALIKANKSFDFLILPDRAHGLNEPYVIRRRWDYFVRHLMGVEPPVDYLIQNR